MQTSIMRSVHKREKNHQLMLLWSVVLLVIVSTRAAQCSYDPQTFSVNSSQPVNPITNCLEYCRQFYSGIPQRAYYNMTSQNCEPLRLCNSTDSHYNYATNLCYSDAQFSKKADSYLPPTILNGTISLVSKTVQMVCLNGDFFLLKIGNPAVCTCKLLWETSGKIDMNGFPFYCDKVTEHPDRHFYKSLKFDKDRKIIQYGPFTAQQMDTILINMKSLQLSQSTQYALNQTQSILYAVNEHIPQQKLLRSEDVGYLWGFTILIFLISGISSWEYEKLRIRIKVSCLKNKLEDVVNLPT